MSAPVQKPRYRQSSDATALDWAADRLAEDAT
jgi:hypothetical protein